MPPEEKRPGQTVVEHSTGNLRRMNAAVAGALSCVDAVNVIEAVHSILLKGVQYGPTIIPNSGFNGPQVDRRGSIIHHRTQQWQ
jgi:hypothetical protein